MSRIRNSKSIVASEENKQIFLKLVGEIGYGKWALIADALLLFGIECKCPQSMPSILKTLKNEEIDRTPTVDPKLLELVLKHTFKVPKINLEYQKLTGQTLEKIDLSSKLKKFFRRAIRDFINMFLRKKRFYTAFFSKYYCQRALKYVIKFSEKSFPDTFMQQISESCKALVEYFKSFIVFVQKDRYYQYGYYKDQFTKRSATVIMDHYAAIVSLTQIQQGQNNIKEFMEISPYIEDTIDKNKQTRLYKVMVEVRSFPTIFKEYHEALHNYIEQSEKFSIDLSVKRKPAPEILKVIKLEDAKHCQTGLLTNTGAIRRKDKIIRPSQYEKKFRIELQKELIKDENDQDKEKDQHLEYQFINYNQQEEKLKNDPELMRHVLSKYQSK